MIEKKRACRLFRHALGGQTQSLRQSLVLRFSPASPFSAENRLRKRLCLCSPPVFSYGVTSSAHVRLRDDFLFFIVFRQTVKNGAPKCAVFCCFLIFQRNIFTVGVDGAGQDHNTFNQAPNACCNRTEATGNPADQGQQKLCDCFSGVTKIEVMYAK